MPDIEKALLDARAVFKCPEDVVNANGLSREQKNRNLAPVGI